MNFRKDGRICLEGALAEVTLAYTAQENENLKNATHEMLNFLPARPDHITEGYGNKCEIYDSAADGQARKLGNSCPDKKSVALQTLAHDMLRNLALPSVCPCIHLRKRNS